MLLYALEQMQELVRFSVENNVLLTVAVPLGLLALLRRGKGTSWIILLVLIGFFVMRGVLAPFFRGRLFNRDGMRRI